MWPFTKKQEPPKPEPPVEIGKRFIYMGVEMLCVRHSQFPYEIPVIVAEYANAHGDIKQHTFRPVDWTALEAELSANYVLAPKNGRVSIANPE